MYMIVLTLYRAQTVFLQAVLHCGGPITKWPFPLVEFVNNVLFHKTTRNVMAKSHVPLPDGGTFS